MPTTPKRCWPSCTARRSCGRNGIILLAGEFVPGFSAIDKQIQILAYAMVFGFAQQLFTQFVDERAKNLVGNVPTKAKGVSAHSAERPRAEARGG